MNVRSARNHSSWLLAYDPLLESERTNIVERHKCSYLPSRESEQSSHGRRSCPECISQSNRENGSRSSACDNESLFDSERKYHGQDGVASGNTHRIVAPEQERQCFQQLNGEQDSGPLSPSNEADQAANLSVNGQEEPAPYRQENDGKLSCPVAIALQELQPTLHQASGGQVDGLANSMAVGEHTVDASCADQELDQITNSTANGNEWRERNQLSDDECSIASNHYACSEEEAMEISRPIQEGNLVSDQRVERPEQPSYQYENGVLANGLMLRSPTQEARQHGSYGIEEQRCETDGEQNCAYNYPVQETGHAAVRLPDEREDLPPCPQLSDDAQENRVSSMGLIEQAVEHVREGPELQSWIQDLDRSASQKATRNKRNPSETFFIVELTQIQQLRQVDVTGEAPAVFSPAIYSDSYEYKLGIRMYPNGLEEERGRSVGLFVHMMMGKYDDVELKWPFTQRITLSILDQSGAKHHISQIIQAKPHLSAFQKPTQAISCTGCGFVKFAAIDEVFSFPCVKDDKMFLNLEFSP